MTPLPPPDGWRRLHPLTPIARLGRALGAFVIIGLGGVSGAQRGHTTTLYVDLAIFGVLLVISSVSWLVTRWRIDQGVLLIESGLLRRTSRRFPPEQLQAVDTFRPVVARILGLAEVRLRMAAHTGGSARLTYLSEPEAESVRARLLAVAHGVAEHSPPPPEQTLFTIPPGPLVGSILLSGLGVVFELVVVGLVLLAVFDPAAIGPAIGGGFSALVGLGTTVYRRLNGEFNLTVAEAPDGLRLRAGLLETAAETIPRGRVQAARLIEPLLWRPFGWCRLVVDVAGKQRAAHENQSVAGALRAVLPVGNKAQAAWLLDRILPGAAALAASAPPARARWKSPLRYHYLSWGHDQTYAFTTSGRVRKVTDWVPLAKVQSIRRVEGPVQRTLHLATVHLDTAGRNVHAAARDRDNGESLELIDRLPVLCRAARG